MGHHSSRSNCRKNLQETCLWWMMLNYGQWRLEIWKEPRSLQPIMVPKNFMVVIVRCSMMMRSILFYVSSPHTFHKDQTLLCLNKGIPVLVEKPITINCKELDTVLKAAERSQTFLMEALWTRFIPSIQKVLEIIASGDMGEVEHVEAEFLLCCSARRFA